jgi:hypothetical protein
MKKFDLNIEKVLESWEVYHAIREIISNALDETVLAKCKDIRIWKDKDGAWHIKDYGRGLMYQHLTQKENDEKIDSPDLIGKFGVGLKDALATFDRRGIKVLIKSKYGHISLVKSEKHGFSDIVTLHAAVEEPADKKMSGTEFVLEGVSDEDMNLAKKMFLKFAGDEILETTSYGQVLKPIDSPVIYISGVKVAEEENFLFSYNITSLTANIKKALNRERTNVGRSAYTDRVKAILLASNSEVVAHNLIDDVGNFTKGNLKDELKWTDVYVHACKLMNSLKKVIFLTPNERSYAAGLLSYARDDGFRIITVPDNVRYKLKGEFDYDGNPIRDLSQFIKQWNDSFKFSFVKVKDLSAKEREIFHRTKEIFDVIGGMPEGVKQVKISETMRMGKPGGMEVVGVWEEDLGRIVIKRSQLVDLAEYAGTLLHETAHAITGAPDVSEVFEQGLTDFLGEVASQVLPAHHQKKTNVKSKKR